MGAPIPLLIIAWNARTEQGQARRVVARLRARKRVRARLMTAASTHAVRLGVSFPRLNEIIRGKRGVTPDTALRLARVLGMSADLWLGLQQDWDLWRALHNKRATQINRLKPLAQR